MIKIFPSKLQGSLIIPPSKSHTLRAILFAALASGNSTIEHPLSSPDTDAMIRAVQSLGAKVQIHPHHLTIQGTGGVLTPPDNTIQCGNSGLVLRLIGALAGLLPHYTILTGDLSLRTRRPIQPLLDGLTQLGAFATSIQGNVLIKGPLCHPTASFNGQDSQPVSGLLIAAAFAPHPITLSISNPGEKPWVDLTLHWFDKLGIHYQRNGYESYSLSGNTNISAFSTTISGDYSSAAFPFAAALLTQSTLTLNNLDPADPQGDKAVLSLLPSLPSRIDVNPIIDALPILAVVGCFAEQPTTLFNGAIARKKESDRISAIAQELKKMGARIEEQPDGLTIHPSTLHGAHLDSHNDHRIALALSVAALAAKSPSHLHNTQCIAKTYPTFFEDLRHLGAHVETLA